MLEELEYLELDEIAIELDERILELDEIVLKLDDEVPELDEITIELDEKILELDEIVLKLDDEVPELDEIAIELDEGSGSVAQFCTICAIPALTNSIQVESDICEQLPAVNLQKTCCSPLPEVLEGTPPDGG